MTTRASSMLIAVALAFSAGCTGEDTASSGDFTLNLTGGKGLMQGYPHDEGGVTQAFADGWTLTFQKYVVVVSNVVLRDPSTQDAVQTFAGPVAIDLRSAGTENVEIVTFNEVAAKRLDLDFDSPAATAGITNKHVEQADLDEMVQKGWSTLVVGEAKKGTDTIKFRIGLPILSRYTQCINGNDQTRGVAIEANKSVAGFIWAHTPHMFWDTLSLGDEDLRFDAFAAVAGADSMVESDELKQQNLTDLKDAQGQPLKDGSGKVVVYNDGGLLAPSKQTLYDFVVFGVRESLHFNGIGLCSARPLSK
jgi:hypothetical protein